MSLNCNSVFHLLYGYFLIVKMSFELVIFIQITKALKIIFFSGSSDNSPNSLSYNDNSDMSQDSSGSLQQSLSVNGDDPIHGSSLDQQEAYPHQGSTSQFTSGFDNPDKR